MTIVKKLLFVIAVSTTIVLLMAEKAGGFIR